MDRGGGLVVKDPGWVKTKMGGIKASKESTQIADDLLFLLTNKIESGNFWVNKKIRNW
jgi:hypothetical protein